MSTTKPSEPSAQFEVGKKYKFSSGTIYECIGVYRDQAWLVEPNGLCGTWTEFSRSKFTEYKEPKKYVGYVNLYPRNQTSGLHHSRKAADSEAGHTRIACKRVEIAFTEGEYDD